MHINRGLWCLVGITKADRNSASRVHLPKNLAYMEHNREAFIHGRQEMKEKKKKSNAKGKDSMTRGLVSEGERGDINERADTFIKNFRNQLRIQREESFRRYQEMISRGV